MQAVTIDGQSRMVVPVKVGKAVLGYRDAIRSVSKGQFRHLWGRLAEIEKLIRHRHGAIIPKTDDAHIYLDTIVALAYVQLCPANEPLFVALVEGWAQKWLPWDNGALVDAAIYERLKVSFKPLSADALACLLNVSFDERTKLDLRTIGAFDVTKAQRTKIARAKRQLRDKTEKARLRRAAGQASRAQYLATSASRQKPWEHYGFSRRTWERKRANGSLSGLVGQPDASASPHNPFLSGCVD
jgi:hypothetical protein